MKKLLFFAALFSLTIFNGNLSFAQCIPGDSTTCPDPEGNGEVCPAVLPPIYIQADYEQQFTVLAPPELDTLGSVITLHHITLLDVLNLPEGIEWQSNALNNEFFVGTYYCVLLSGVTNAAPGNYPIKIVVDIYASVAGTPVKLGTTVDSTSLSVEVTWNPNSIFENSYGQENLKIWPVPFQNEVNVQLKSFSGGKVQVEMYNLLGGMVFQQELEPDYAGKFFINTSLLKQGSYLLSISYGGSRFSKMISGNK
jgi:hypothetical protein